MQRLSSLLTVVACSLMGVLSCSEEKRNTEELIDPWLRERTPVALRLESQIGGATITKDWRNDSEGSVNVTLVTGSLDMSKVKVISLDFKYPDSEYCPTASIGPGSTVDLSNGSTQFTVTAYNGETRTYTLTYQQFVDPVAGTYSFVPHCCWVYGGNMGSWSGTYVTSMDNKGWNFTDYNHGWEDDNVLTITCTGADEATGDTYGTFKNDAGADGKYASFGSNWGNLSNFYRCIPMGEGTYFKEAASGKITFKGIYNLGEGNVAIEKTCEIWNSGAHGPLATIYADDLEHGGADSQIFHIPEGQLAFAFKIPADTPGLTILNSTDWTDKDKFYYFPKFFFVLASKP